jgi:hypothetical protein
MKNFTSLIDQYDLNSHLDCSLIVPYQFLDSPGGDLILQIEKHSAPITAVTMTSDNSNSYSFSLSDKLLCYCTSNVTELGEIKIAHSAKEGYNILITYIYENFEINEVVPLKIFNGGFIIANSNTFISYSFDSSIYFQKDFETDSILDLFLISSNHALVCLNGKNCFDIYNIFTSELVKTESFGFKIQNVYTNLNRIYVVPMREFVDERLVIVVLENMNLLVLKVVSKSSIRENLYFPRRETNEIDLIRILETQCPGNQIVSLNFILHSSYGNTFDTGPEFVVCYDDGSFLMADPRSKDKSTSFFKPKIRKNEKIHFKIIDKNGSNYRSFLLLGSNKCLYLMNVGSYLSKEINFLIEISGNFENGIILPKNKIAGIDKTNIYFYSFHIDLPNNKYKIRKDNQINAHYDDITFLFLADQNFIFTASKDSNIKAFFSNKIKSDEEITTFDRTKSEIAHISILGKNHVISLESLRYFLTPITLMKFLSEA